MIKGGGIGQASDPPGGTTISTRYCSTMARRRSIRVIAAMSTPRAAIDFLSTRGDRPFFAYLAFNCPHEPLEAPEAELASYRRSTSRPASFPSSVNRFPPLR